VRPLRYRDNRRDPAGWAQRLRISREAVELYLDCDVVDAHCCSYMWTRFLGYDLSRRHTPFMRGTPFFNQVDFPRAREGALTGMVWDITTYPFRASRGRRDAFERALGRMLGFIRRHPQELAVVRTVSDYRAAKAAGKLACWISVQGGNALDHSLDTLSGVAGDLVSRITLVHFTKSKIGLSNTDLLRRRSGLTPFGRRYVERMVDRNILVDLSHINRSGFFDALDVVPRDVPVAVTHTGLKALRDVPRNIDDEQLRAVTERGGVVGIVYQANFIRRALYDYGIEDVLDHMEHVLKVAGEDHLILGSDYDGLVILPRDLADVTEQPKLVDAMLRRGWTHERIRKVLGENYLRVLGRLRP
jgi:membrane dipeptidase